MRTYNIHAAKTHLSRLVDAVAGGETIIVTKAGIPVAKLVPITMPRRRGMLRGVTLNAEASDALDAATARLFVDNV
ncbi:type II toxin-antitoxin system Phd/YefM family antitoxin [Pseudomonas sp. LP_7_YM]|uniref:type II toxin-antitoxin system Phd/YefM family antitoxin n=1 Tax=Pseudomonas sp. LP_7_YM TaxID=2485137 RepID=UPI00105CCCDE|nr:type II toxin-antitoxin system prevent-host-death family antitoxin [Pseudomonas sp. LP_7_YM]